MAGISPIDSIFFSRSLAQNNDTLTAATRAKLTLLGVDTSNIRTESEGRTVLQRTMSMQGSSQTQFVSGSAKREDEASRLAQSLAYDLNIPISDNDSLDDIIVKIKYRISELQAEAKNNKGSLSAIKDYSDRLALIEQAQLSQINLSTTMNMIADNNRSYFGL